MTLIVVSLVTNIGCQSIRSEPTEYVIAVGKPVWFTYADWTFDLCAKENAALKPGELACIQSGGEVYKGEFSNLQVLAGHLPTGSKYIGVVGHALKKNQRDAAPMLLVLKRSGPALKRDTGLKYFTVDYGYLDDELCFHETLEETTGLIAPRLHYKGAEKGYHCYTLN